MGDLTPHNNSCKGLYRISFTFTACALSVPSICIPFTLNVLKVGLLYIPLLVTDMCVCVCTILPVN